MDEHKINQLKVEIDQAKEYLDNNLCKECEEMAKKIESLQEKLKEIQNNS
jgi:hypothetical protein